MPDSAVDIDAELTALGELGVIQIAPLQAAKDESIERVDARIKQLRQRFPFLTATMMQNTPVLKMMKLPITRHWKEVRFFSWKRYWMLNTIARNWKI